MPPKKITYKALKDQREHVLLRPDMYIGSVVTNKQLSNVVNLDKFPEISITKKEVRINPGLLRIFIEALSNAIDNVWRSKDFDVECTKIKVNIEKTGKTSVWNDGLSIPIEKNEESGLYTPEMIFGKLLSSSNYNDSEERFTSGLNGLGAKCTNLFSTTFIVRIFDPKSSKLYTQKWKNNMGEKEEPTIVETTKFTTGFTEVTWYPDFSRFGETEYSDDMLSLIYKHVVDAAMITKTKIFLNTHKITIKTLKEYAKLFQQNDDEEESENEEENETTEELIYIKNEHSEVVIIPNSTFDTISFVNGVETVQGGIHVDSWTESFCRPIVDKLNDKNKKKEERKINISHVKNFFKFFINSTLPNPSFSSQDKTKLISYGVKEKHVEIKCAIPEKDIKTVLKWSSVENKVEAIFKTKELMALKKTEKKKGFIKIEKYRPANNEGSLECSLILCEGDSASTYAITGIEVGVNGKKGRNYHGIFALKGKFLNVRNASIKQLSANKEVLALISILNLKYDVDYTEDSNFSSLNYGRVILLTDSDCDGTHIAGLLINFFHALFPSLLKRKDPFIVLMKTPIVRINTKSEKLCFYEFSEFKKFQEENKDRKFKKGEVKYYKGLGTSTDKEIFDSFGKKLLEFSSDKHSDKIIEKVFHKDYANDRKKWLEEYNPSYEPKLSVVSDTTSKMSISEFVDKQVIDFSIVDCKRSIPCIVDGLKESQRKIIYSCFLRNLKHTGDTLKVATLAGYVVEKSNYHYGDQCLHDTIIKLSQDFVGSNNIPLLYRGGQMGSRLHNGKDAASARYVSTKLEKLTRLIFNEEDDVLLNRELNDDGEQVEPTFYVPIIPMILVNGCSGIGTGWSSDIPCYNPLDIVKCVKMWLKDNSNFKADITPWYNDFEGVIEKDENTKFNRYITYGKVSQKGKTSYKVEEIPIGQSISDFEEFLMDLKADKAIKNYKAYSDRGKNKPHFVIEESKDGINCSLETLKLKSYLQMGNMVLFSREGNLKRYSNVGEIINEFCKIRYEYYELRKAHILKALRLQKLILENKIRFLLEVINDELIIHKREEEDVVSEMETKNYFKKDGNYNYLLNMQIRSFTKTKTVELENELKTTKDKIEIVENKTEKEMWLEELDSFETEYLSWNKKK